jgi:hypothetical protein
MDAAGIGQCGPAAGADGFHSGRASK